MGAFTLVCLVALGVTLAERSSGKAGGAAGVGPEPADGGPSSAATLPTAVAQSGDAGGWTRAPRAPGPGQVCPDSSKVMSGTAFCAEENLGKNFPYIAECDSSETRSKKVCPKEWMLAHWKHFRKSDEGLLTELRQVTHDLRAGRTDTGPVVGQEVDPDVLRLLQANQDRFQPLLQGDAGVGAIDREAVRSWARGMSASQRTVLRGFYHQLHDAHIDAGMVMPNLPYSEVELRQRGCLDVHLVLEGEHQERELQLIARTRVRRGFSLNP